MADETETVEPEQSVLDATKAEHHGVLQGLRDRLEQILAVSRAGNLVHAELGEVVRDLDETHGTRGTDTSAQVAEAPAEPAGTGEPTNG